MMGVQDYHPFYIVQKFYDIFYNGKIYNKFRVNTEWVTSEINEPNLL